MQRKMLISKRRIASIFHGFSESTKPGYRTRENSESRMTNVEENPIDSIPSFLAGFLKFQFWRLFRISSFGFRFMEHNERPALDTRKVLSLKFGRLRRGASEASVRRHSHSHEFRRLSLQRN